MKQNKDTKHINIAVVGCGYWGKNLVRNFAQLGNLKAICDNKPELSGPLSKEHNVPVWDFEEVLNSPDIQGVVIATPASSHYAIAEAVLKSGKNVFIEKPIALDVQEAQALCDLAKEMKKIIMVGHILNYHPAFIKMKELVDNKIIGDLQYVYSNRLSFGKLRTEENILWSFAPHDISMILNLVKSKPLNIDAHGASHLSSGVEDITTTHLTFENNINAHIFVSWLHPYKEQKLVVVGDNGMMVFNDAQPWESKLQHYPHKVTWSGDIPVPEKADAINIDLEEAEPLKEECRHFISCIENNTQPVTNGDEGVRVLEVLQKAQESLAKKKENPQPQTKKSYYVHPTSIIDKGAEIGQGTKIWHFNHISSSSKIGKDCILGQNIMIGPDVEVGNKCKIQNNVSLYKGVRLSDGVFCGPSCVFTNVNTPRAEIERKNEFLYTEVGHGATIGANSTIICGVKLGDYCLIGAGAVVSKDVFAHALVVGVPAKQIGWVSHAGERLGKDLICPRENRQYFVDKNGQLKEKV